MSQTLGLGGVIPRFVNRSWLRNLTGSVIRVQCDEFWHMTKVLRVQLFNGKGSLVEGCIQNIDRTGLDFVALNDLISIPPPNTQLHVFAGFGTLKGGRADWLLEKCTELGANSVTPLLTELDNYYKSIYFYSVIPYRKCNIIKKYMDIKISWASKAKG
ncbi:hypothetical protein glysoja_044490 [Glycine soja]|uniref:16S rRNA (uracil(1498)-N(3))-methyltransferase n=1 Tax=Glycine soja TaxID=3848 RepID=A0A0B2QSU8_GLYSO|nr:hypothetical protein glysoja_044490 [Glycine soja]